MEMLNGTILLLLQQGGYNDARDEMVGGMAALLAFFFMMLLVMILVMLAINIAVCLLVINGYKPVPPEHQKIAPNKVWLLLIPLFNVVWNFIVFQRIPESYQSAFAAQGRTDVGDCGKNIGLWFSIAVACSFVPCVNYLAGPAALVLLILFLVKLYDLKGKLLAPAPAAAPAGDTPPAAN